MMPSLNGSNNRVFESHRPDFVSDIGSSDGALTEDESDLCEDSPNGAVPPSQSKDGVPSFNQPPLPEQLPSPQASPQLRAKIMGNESDLSQAHTTGIQQGQKVTGINEQRHLGIMPVEGKEEERVLRLSPSKIYELTSTQGSLPLRDASLSLAQVSVHATEHVERIQGNPLRSAPEHQRSDRNKETSSNKSRSGGSIIVTPMKNVIDPRLTSVPLSARGLDYGSRPHLKSRTFSTPPFQGSHGSSKANEPRKHPLSPSSPNLAKMSLPIPPLQIPEGRSEIQDPTPEDLVPSPMPSSIPAPPFSLPTYLQLELSSSRPSPLYIHRSATSDFPYESSHVKIERLQNFLLLPLQLEQVLWFGALACLDAWLFSFTILPLRFLKALSILIHSWGINLSKEVRLLAGFIYSGTGRVWRRRRKRRDSTNAPHLARSVKSEAPSTPQVSYPSAKENPSTSHSHPDPDRTYNSSSHTKKHYRSKSTPSALLPDHKADILKGFLIFISCTILMYFDASRMYHGIRGQAAIKLYVIYNVLEVCDRLFSALGQDVLECLFSKEALERKPDGRSKVLRPLWLFVLALFYNLIHATSLFYQVITLNVAVNSYSNALLTLLMSNQFVEIKSTVFKKFEKENLFQLTCADVVERFQLWLMLLIIASRNIIETGVFSLGLAGSSGGSSGSHTGSAAPLTGSSILPKGFTMLPDWTEQVIGPFLLVLGSEMIVDWVKHAYITKFNNTKPAIYGRFLDVLAKDYYSNAFADQNLTRRLGLPVIPLSCLFIRASLQTYHMFLATHVPLPIPSTATSLSVDSATTSNPATTAALQHIDHIVRRALGRSTFGAGYLPSSSPSSTGLSSWTTDDLIAFLTMLTFFSLLFLVLLALKLVLGMCLLSFARRRYKGMKEREQISVHADGKRVGGWGVVEVGEDKRRWIYHDNPDEAKRLREREDSYNKREEGGKGGEERFRNVRRYSMVAKRIW